MVFTWQARYDYLEEFSMKSASLVTLSSAFLLTALAGCGAAQSNEQTAAETQGLFDQKSIEISVEPTRDDVKVVMPKNADSRKDWPLIILLHGFGASGSLQDIYFGASGNAGSKGFVIAMPNGIKNSNGKRFWNAFDACCDFEASKVNDIRFLTSLIAKVKQQVGIDSRRVTLLGHSNGGYMSYKMACEVPELIAGVAVLAGSMSGDFKQFCPKALPTSVLHIHGNADETVSYGGGIVPFSGKSFMSAPETAKTWAANNNCKSHIVTGRKFIDLVSFVQLPGVDTFAENWNDCDGGSRVEFLTIEKGKHAPAFGFGGGTFIQHSIDFLLSARR